jgi:hypothetical protein
MRIYTPQCLNFEEQEPTPILHLYQRYGLNMEIQVMRAEQRRRKLTPGVEEMEARDVPSVAAGQMFASFMAVRQMELRAMSMAALANRFAHMSSPRVLSTFPAVDNMLHGHLMPTDQVVVRPTVILNEGPVQVQPPHTFIGPFIPGQPPQIHGTFSPTTMILE